MINIPKHICSVLNILKDNGFEGYLVGGCVRDSLMGKEAHDFDITTNALPDEMLLCFKDMRIIETGLKHGTVTVVSEGENVEITTYRIDGKYVDNRHPEKVIYTRDIHEDLSRRDFTVNSLAYSPYEGLVDLFDGANDIKNKILRSVGNPDTRFNEDGLRIMRALRFSSVLSFQIDVQTKESIHRNKELLLNISRERIFSEFKKLICGVGASDIIDEFFDVFNVIFPGISVFKNIVIQNTKLLSLLPDDAEIRLTTLFFGVETDFVKKALVSLKPDNKLYGNVMTLLKYGIQDIMCDEISVKYIMRELCQELIGKLAIIKKIFNNDFNDKKFLKIHADFLKNNECVSLKQLAINGSDILKLGVANGPEIGKVLNFLLDEVIIGKCENDKESLIKHLNKNYFSVPKL